MTKDTEAFKFFRKKLKGINELDHQIFFIQSNNNADQMAFEGACVKRFNPIVNNETWENHKESIAVKEPLKKVIDTMKKELEHFEMNTKIQSIPFTEFKKINSKIKGVYVIYDEKLGVWYVGKGNIRDRQKQHHNKNIGLVK